jgi:hypothetical protein
MGPPAQRGNALWFEADRNGTGRRPDPQLDHLLADVPEALVTQPGERMMHNDWPRISDDDGLDALVAKLNSRYLILAEAVDTARAQYLNMERIPHTRLEHLVPARRQWQLLERQRLTFAAQLAQLDN